MGFQIQKQMMDRKEAHEKLMYHMQMVVKLQAKLMHMKEDEPGPEVTEHAIVRYLERVRGVDIQEVIKAIKTPQLLKLHDKLGGGILPTGEDQVLAICKGNKVLTIYKK